MQSVKSWPLSICDTIITIVFKIPKCIETNLFSRNQSVIWESGKIKKRISSSLTESEGKLHQGTR